MLIYKEDNPAMKAAVTKPLSDYQDRFFVSVRPTTF
jgi:hypothetical protein